MAFKKPSIVIVPGAWQFASSFDILRHKLIALGYPTEVLELPSTGSPPPRKSLEDDAEALRDILSYEIEQGNKVVVIAHSYGGLVTSNAIEGLVLASPEGRGGGILHLIYITAFAIPKGKSLSDMFPDGKLQDWQHLEGDIIKVDPLDACQIAFSDLSSFEATKYSSELSHTSLSCFMMPATYEPWRDVECSYIFTTDDAAIPYPVQKQMASQFGEVKTIELKSGHCPNISMPDKLVEGVDWIIRECR